MLTFVTAQHTVHASKRITACAHRANHKVKLEDIELPDNHPWATKANNVSSWDEGGCLGVHAQHQTGEHRADLPEAMLTSARH